MTEPTPPRPSEDDIPRVPIKRLFIANRGEIACRIIRTCRQLGVTTVVPVAPVDRASRAARLADLVVPLEHNRSYLDATELVSCARRTHCDALHPGYGFLSENAQFASQVIDSGIVWVGPPPLAIELLGDKMSARAHAIARGVRVIPGLAAPCASGVNWPDQELLNEIERDIGFPLVIKASLGGGGRGMRIAESREQLSALLEAASREAEQFFGMGSVFIERRIFPARHIEVQVVADAHGDVATIGDRDCTLQRFHQKIIEECPAPFLDATTRRELHEAALELVRNTQYQGVATVEFLLDPEGRWYFLEVNTRLQVEHPVTEMVHATDLVALQLAIAQGEPLTSFSWSQEPQGHAIETRICAEYVGETITPAAGTLELVNLPPSCRIERGYDAGDIIPDCYDSLVMKLIDHAPTRELAITAARDSLQQLHIAGIATNISFLDTLLSNQDFRKGSHHLTLTISLLPSPQELLAAYLRQAALTLTAWVYNQYSLNQYSLNESPQLASSNATEERLSMFQPWRTPSGFRLFQQAQLHRLVTIDAHQFAVQATWSTEGLHVTAQATQPPDIAERFFFPFSPATARPRILDEVRQLTTEWYSMPPRTWTGAVSFPSSRRVQGQSLTASTLDVVSPLPGRIIAIHVREGEEVTEGTLLLTLESMKMEHQIRAPRSGSVTRCWVAKDATIQKGSVLFSIGGVQSAPSPRAAEPSPQE